MKNQIKELRVKIDGLAQLTKKLKPINTMLINVNMLPKDFNAEHWLKLLKTQPHTLIESKNSEGITSLEMFPEISKCYDSLILAKAWLGKILLEIGDTNPYSKSDGNRESIKDIEPTADKNEDIHGHNLDVVHFEDKNHVEKVDWLREEIKTIVDETEDFSKKEPHIELEQGFVYKYLCEARFWLGFELQRIRENE